VNISENINQNITESILRILPSTSAPAFWGSGWLTPNPTSLRYKEDETGNFATNTFDKNPHCTPQNIPVGMSHLVLEDLNVEIFWLASFTSLDQSPVEINIANHKIRSKFMFDLSEFMR